MAGPPPPVPVAWRGCVWPVGRVVAGAISGGLCLLGCRLGARAGHCGLSTLALASQSTARPAEAAGWFSEELTGCSLFYVSSTLGAGRGWEEAQV